MICIKRVRRILYGLATLAPIITVSACQQAAHYLEAQTRAQVSRTRNDMRSLATAIEAYNVDHNVYPAFSVGPDSVNGNLRTSNVASALPSFRAPEIVQGKPRFATLTTPVAYATSLPRDVFSPGQEATFVFWSVEPGHPDPSGKIVGKDSPTSGTGWILVSPGPDGDYDVPVSWDVYDPRLPQPSPRLMGGANANNQAFTYDPTNGTESGGDIWRVKQ
jgi:hypothetical protein